MTSGTTGSLTVFLTAAAVGGTVVTLSSSNPTLLSVPASVTVPAGAIQAVVSATVGTASTATNVVVRGTGLTTKTATIQVVPAPVDLASLSSAATMTSRTTGSLTVFLTAAAPVGGTVVTLSSSNPALLSVPASVMRSEEHTSE